MTFMVTQGHIMSAIVEQCYRIMAVILKRSDFSKSKNVCIYFFHTSSNGTPACVELIENISLFAIE